MKLARLSALHRYTPLRRYTPARRFRPGPPRRGQLSRKEKAELRARVYAESGGRCELRCEGCAGGVLPSRGTVFRRWHLVHLRSKRRFGWDRTNLCGGCYHCHIEVLHGRGRGAL